MESSNAFRQALKMQIELAFPLEEIGEFNDTRDFQETKCLSKIFVGKNWQEIDTQALITHSYSVNYCGPQTAVALLPVLMMVILYEMDCEFIPENTMRLLSREGNNAGYTALELLQSSINRVIEEELFLPEILAPAVDALDKQINQMYEQMGFHTELHQEYLKRYKAMKLLLTRQQSTVVRFFLFYLSEAEFYDEELREAAGHALLFW